MQARYYDPTIGRFLAPDPVQFAPDRPGYFNRYSYALNDPVNMVDPDGRKPRGFKLEGVAVGVAYGGRVDIGVTYDREKGTIAAFIVGGGNLDPAEKVNVIGAQAGVGASYIEADSIEAITSEGFSSDLDIGVISSGVITEGMILETDGNVREEEIGKRQGFSFGFGLGGGGSQIKTRGRHWEGQIHKPQKQKEPPQNGSGIESGTRDGDPYCLAVSGC